MGNFDEAVKSLPKHELMCPKCGEHRLLDLHRTYCVCQVCACRFPKS